MADYYPLIARAIAGLDPNAPGESRRALYERARTALIQQLRGVQPPLSESEITRERLSLEEAVRKVESEAAQRARDATRSGDATRSEGDAARSNDPSRAGGDRARAGDSFRANVRPNARPGEPSPPGLPPSASPPRQRPPQQPRNERPPLGQEPERQDPRQPRNGRADAPPLPRQQPPQPPSRSRLAQDRDRGPKKPGRIGAAFPFKSAIAVGIVLILVGAGILWGKSVVTSVSGLLKPSTVAEAPKDAGTPLSKPKIPDRVGQPSPTDQVAPVAQRVVLYDEDPADP